MHSGQLHQLTSFYTQANQSDFGTIAWLEMVFHKSTAPITITNKIII